MTFIDVVCSYLVYWCNVHKCIVQVTGVLSDWVEESLLIWCSVTYSTKNQFLVQLHKYPLL